MVPPLFDSIQSFQIEIPDTVGFVDITITEVDLSRAVIIWGGFGASSDAGTHWAGAYFVSSTTVKVIRRGSAAGNFTTVSFSVVEFSASQVKSVQSFSGTITANNTFFDVTITEVDLLKSIILYCGHKTNTIAVVLEQQTLFFTFQSSTTVRATRYGSGAGVLETFYGMVLESL